MPDRCEKHGHYLHPAGVVCPNCAIEERDALRARVAELEADRDRYRANLEFIATHPELSLETIVGMAKTATSR